MNKKKEIERYHLTTFISNLKLEVLSIKDDETLDFIIETKNKIISVELMSLVNPKIREIEEYRNRVVKQVENRFQDKYHAVLNVHVTFANVILNRKVESIYLDSLFKIIEGIYLTNNEKQFNHTYNAKKEEFFLETVYISNDLGFHNWQSNSL